MKYEIKERVLVGLVSSAITFSLGVTWTIHRKISEPPMSFYNWRENGKKVITGVYNGTNYLFKVGTNGIPYFEPIKGLENSL